MQRPLSQTPRVPVRNVRCYHCSRPVQVSTRAMSVSCPHCYRGLVIDDLVIKADYFGRRLETCGHITITHKGHVVAPTLTAVTGVTVQGELEANVISRGPVHIGSAADWCGDCIAPSITIELGARVRGGRFTISPSAAERFLRPPDPPKQARSTTPYTVTAHIDPAQVRSRLNELAARTRLAA